MLDALSALIRLYELDLLLNSLSGEHRRRAEIEIQRCKNEIPEEVLERYEQLKEHFDRSAVAKIKQGVCTGCNLTVPRSNMKTIAADIYVCEHCGRLLIDSELAYFETSAP